MCLDLVYLMNVRGYGKKFYGLKKLNIKHKAVKLDAMLK